MFILWFLNKNPIIYNLSQQIVFSLWHSSQLYPQFCCPSPTVQHTAIGLCVAELKEKSASFEQSAKRSLSRWSDRAPALALALRLALNEHAVGLRLCISKIQKTTAQRTFVGLFVRLSLCPTVSLSVRMSVCLSIVVGCKPLLCMAAKMFGIVGSAQNWLEMELQAAGWALRGAWGAARWRSRRRRSRLLFSLPRRRRFVVV